MSAAAAADLSKEKPRLTEQEKKNNHIASEQKRRQAIREGFDRLANLVPGMEGQGRSESLVLTTTIEYMKKELDEYHRLLEIAQAKGLSLQDLEVPDLEPPPENGINGGNH